MTAIVLHGDLATFDESFGAAIVTAGPGVMVASGRAACGKLKLCVDGDEASVVVPATYTTAQHTIAGAGIVTIESLHAQQQAGKARSGGKALILATASFTAKFQVTVPAQQPQPAPASPVPDTTPSYSGTGEFTTTNQRSNAT